MFGPDGMPMIGHDHHGMTGHGHFMGRYRIGQAQCFDLLDKRFGPAVLKAKREEIEDFGG